MIVDFLFLSDIVFTFILALTMENGLFNTDRAQIAQNYIRGWFFLDLFTSLPFQLIEKLDPSSDKTDGNAKLLRLARLPRLYRLLRLLRLFKLLRLIKFGKTGSNTFKLSYQTKESMKLIGQLLFMTHLVSCFWFY